MSPWSPAPTVVAVHMAVLLVMLLGFYGYGYEHDLKVLGTLSLYFLLFVFLRRKLSNLHFRRCAGTMLAVLYIALMLRRG